MGTVRDLITASLLDLGVIASGESPTAAEAQDAFRRVNLLLETWRLESLLTFSIDTVTLVLTGAASYTWGSGGAIPSTRPVRLHAAAQRSTVAGQTLDYPLDILTDLEYESIALKGLTTSVARWVYLDRAYPLATLSTYPILPSGDTLLLYVWHPLTAFASLDTSITLPPGYELALQTNLSIELSSSYRDSTLTQALIAQATRSKALLKAINAQPRAMRMPAALLGGVSWGVTSRRAFESGGSA